MAYCVNGSWTVSNKIAVGTETLGLGLTLQGPAVGDAAIAFRNSSATGRNWSIYATGNEFSQGAGSLLFYREWCDGGNGTMVLSCMGRLGMGTCNPTHPIHVYDAGNSVYARWERSSGNMFIGSDSIGGAIGTTGNIPLYFYTVDGTERMRLTQDGSLGIGTSCPTAKLHVNGSSQFDDSLNFASRGKISWGGSPARLILTSCGSYNLSLGTDNFVDRMTIQASTGNVGIGNCSPAGQFSLNGAISDCKLLVYDAGVANDRYGFGIRTSQFMMYSANAGDACGGITFGKHNGTTFTEHVRFMNGGNVGIGISCANYKLHVNGTFYAAGSSQDYKEGICKYDTDSCMFMKLKPVTYQYKEEFKHLGKELKSQTQIGLIAEEVAEVAPELAILVKENDNDVVRNVDYEKLSIILLSEVQKLRKEVDDLKTK
jgi:hypothetical protein